MTSTSHDPRKRSPRSLLYLFCLLALLLGVVNTPVIARDEDPNAAVDLTRPDQSLLPMAPLQPSTPPPGVLNEVPFPGAIPLGVAVVTAAPPPRVFTADVGVDIGVSISPTQEFQLDVVDVGVVTDINVAINLTHNDADAISIDLVSPSGVTLPLYMGGVGVPAPGINLIWDDDAPQSPDLNCGCATATQGMVLDTFQGVANGPWILRVTNSPDVSISGALISWGLTFEVAVPGAGNGWVYVTDGVGGAAHVFSTDLQPLGAPIASPVPAASMTSGIAYDPVGLLYWVDATAGLLYTTDLVGTFLRERPLAVPFPTSIVGGATYDDVNQSLWFVDVINDVIFETTLDGQLAGGFFRNPAVEEPGAGAFGIGVTHIPGTRFFDIYSGSLIDRRPTEIIRVHEVGGGIGGSLRLAIDEMPAGDGFPTGLAYFPQNQSYFRGGGAGGDVIEVLAVQNCPETPIDCLLACTVLADGSVSMTFNYAGPGSGLVECYRRELPSGTKTLVAAGTFSSASPTPTLTNTPPKVGCYEYSFMVLYGDPEVSCDIGGCKVCVEKICHDHKRLANSSQLFDAAVSDATGLLYITDADVSAQFAQVLDGDLQELPPIPQPAPGESHTGIAWDAASNTLYWLSHSPGSLGLTLHRTDMMGASVAAPVSLGVPDMGVPGASPLAGGMDIAEDLLGLVVYFIDLDEVHFYSFLEIATDPFPQPQLLFANPGSAFPTYGAGVARLPGGGYELPGSDGNCNVDVIRTVDSSGLLLPAIFTPVAIPGNPVGDPFITGLAIGDGACGPTRYLVGNTTRTVYRMSLPSYPQFIRGDATLDGVVGLNDVLASLNYQFLGGTLLCLEAANVNAIAGIDLNDALYLLNYLFLGGSEPPIPFPACGFADQISVLGCEDSSCP